MSQFEQYRVIRAPQPIDANQTKLTVDPKAGTAAFTPIDFIMLVNGVPAGGQNRTGQEDCAGWATIYLDNATFAEANAKIRRDSYLNYSSDPIQGPACAVVPPRGLESIQYFNF
jgi:hypothetical protein